MGPQGMQQRQQQPQQQQQPQNPNQQRMMRPSNPGLRMLLQQVIIQIIVIYSFQKLDCAGLKMNIMCIQQPYRPAMMNQMQQQQMGARGPMGQPGPQQSGMQQQFEPDYDY